MLNMIMMFMLKILLEDATFGVPKSPFYCEPSKKRANVAPCKILGFFLSSYKFKMTWHNQVLWSISCHLLLKGCCLWGLWSPFGFNRWHDCVHRLSSHPRKHLLRKSCWIWLRRPWIHMWFMHKGAFIVKGAKCAKDSMLCND
jgi:hypothetical protein